jgi:serine protease inhibitor
MKSLRCRFGIHDWRTFSSALCKVTVQSCFMPHPVKVDGRTELQRCVRCQGIVRALTTTANDSRVVDYNLALSGMREAGIPGA